MYIALSLFSLHCLRQMGIWLFGRNPKAFRTIGIGFANVRSFDTKPALRISRKPFDLESPNFTRTSTPTLSIFKPDMVLLSTSGWKLYKRNFEITAFDGFGWNFSTTVWARITTILHNYRRQPAPQTLRKWLHQLLPVGIYRGSTNGWKCRIRRLCLHYVQCQRRLQISRVENIGNVLDKSGVAFRLTPPYGELLVNNKRPPRLLRSTFLNLRNLDW